MTWTFDPTDMSTDLSRVRSNIGDVIEKDPFLTDEQIAVYLAATPDVTMASISAIRTGILPLIARRVDRSGTGYSASRSQMTQHYKDLLRDLELESSNNATSTWGGTSISERETLEEDTDFVPPYFRDGENVNQG